MITPEAILPTPPAEPAASTAFLQLLDRTAAGLASHTEVGVHLYALEAGCAMARAKLDAAGWAACCRAAQAHPVMEYLRQDPFVLRCNQRPRGYAGDAVIIDMLYHHADVAPQVVAATPMGRQMHTLLTNVPMAQAVCDRRQLLVELIDDTAQRVGKPDILAVAAGHLRESELSSAIAGDQIGRFVALDQDPESIAVIQAKHGDRVELVPKPIASLLKGAMADQRFHLIYAAGLYDYLDLRVASALTKRLANMLHLGGRLIFANFAEGIWEAGFIEAIHDWHLILRDEAAMQAITAGLPDAFTARHWSGSNGDMHYAEITRTA
jgi:hypothetical protein